MSCQTITIPLGTTNPVPVLFTTMTTSTAEFCFVLDRDCTGCGFTASLFHNHDSGTLELLEDGAPIGSHTCQPVPRCCPADMNVCLNTQCSPPISISPRMFFAGVTYAYRIVTSANCAGGVGINAGVSVNAAFTITTPITEQPTASPTATTSVPTASPVALTTSTTTMTTSGTDLNTSMMPNTTSTRFPFSPSFSSGSSLSNSTSRSSMSIESIEAMSRAQHSPLLTTAVLPVLATVVLCVLLMLVRYVVCRCIRTRKAAITIRNMSSATDQHTSVVAAQEGA